MKIGKWSLFSLLFVAGLSFLLVVSSAHSEELEAKHSKVWVGSWNMRFDWDCNGVDGSVTWTIDKKGTFTSSSGASGTWTGSKKKITLLYSSGCKPAYEGTMKTKGSVEGTMACTSGTGNGCWTATKNGKAVEGDASDDVPSYEGNVPQKLDSGMAVE